MGCVRIPSLCGGLQLLLSMKMLRLVSYSGVYRGLVKGLIQQLASASARPCCGYAVTLIQSAGVFIAAFPSRSVVFGAGGM